MTLRSRLVPITAEQLPAVATCPACAARFGVQPDQELPTWASATQHEWGLCGVGVQLGSAFVGHLLLCPSLHIPRSSPQSVGPHIADSVTVLAIRVLPEYAGHGLGRQLVQSAATRASRLGLGCLELRGTSGAACCVLPPVGFLTAVGFEVSVAHPLTPQLRLDLSRTVRWRPGLLNSALGRLGDWVRPLPPEPASRAVERSGGGRVGPEQLIA